MMNNYLYFPILLDSRYGVIFVFYGLLEHVIAHLCGQSNHCGSLLMADFCACYLRQCLVPS